MEPPAGQTPNYLRRARRGRVCQEPRQDGFGIPVQRGLSRGDEGENGCPAGTRTPTRGTKNPCATITPPGYKGSIMKGAYLKSSDMDLRF